MSSTAINDRMTSSGASLLDSTPSDSGVQLLDSESSELMNESLMSNSGFGFDVAGGSDDMDRCSVNALILDAKDFVSVEIDVIEPSLDDKPTPVIIPTNLTKSDIVNSNVLEHSQIADELISSVHSTFDTENIVYRRRGKKTKNHAPKKRVSFHEDILKNTKTDNIHIEHGFITYKGAGGQKMVQPQAGRYSWCSEGDTTGDFNENRHQSQVVYRNACSDVLDYGDKMDVYDNTNAGKHFDNSGVFEYVPLPPPPPASLSTKIGEFYKCSCSDSNSSLDSGSSQSDENNGADRNYPKSKSNSCDCIGTTTTTGGRNNNMIITDNCYYSEPSFEIIERTGGRSLPKSVWSKDKKPKSSCLKKSKRHTDILLERNLNTKVKKFNVHPLPDMNNLLDNSRMIFGSLKNIFSIPLPERGVAEGSEDHLQPVYECIPESDVTTTTNGNHQQSIASKSRPFLSKSLDGGGIRDMSGVGVTNKFVHNVDDQLRRMNESDLYAPTRQNSRDFVINTPDDDDEGDKSCVDSGDDVEKIEKNKDNLVDVVLPKLEFRIDANAPMTESQNYRNKFIINCESTVFEHTGVSFCYEGKSSVNPPPSAATSQAPTPILGPPTSSSSSPSSATPPLQLGSSSSKILSSFSAAPLKQKISNMFKNFTDSTQTTINTAATTPSFEKMRNAAQSTLKTIQDEHSAFPNLMDMSFTSSCSDTTISDMTTSTNYTDSFSTLNVVNKTLTGLTGSTTSPRSKNRHLASPLRKKNMTTRYATTAENSRGNRMSPDLFNHQKNVMPILSDDFDDILTITTTADDKTTSDGDLVIVDYPAVSESFLKPPQPNNKSSLINRFLRTVTQKKLIDATLKKNNVFMSKLRNEKKLFENLYVKVPSTRQVDKDVLDDFNAEIAMEIEMLGSPVHKVELKKPVKEGLSKSLPAGDSGGGLIVRDHFEIGVGEVSIEIFNGNYLHILRSTDEILMKAFKLYTGYSRDGFMTPVLVFLTDRTLYVTDLVRNRLCNKFVLPYSDLDVILMGPYGNTVLLSNGSRDMQQVLLAGGPYPADGLVASLEMCARRGGTTLPAVGQLTLDHLAPLQAFVRDNSSVLRSDPWVYYAVVNVPAMGAFTSSPDPMGPHIKGPLMHRNVSAIGQQFPWQPGYFLLKAGVLYMFNDSAQKIPTYAFTLPECQGARRAMQAGRPHCFELLLKSGLLQLAAPDEYVASEWLQALVQAASGLFEMQDKHLTLGCTLIMTPNHLITLREDFGAPLRRLNSRSPSKENLDPNVMVSSMSGRHSAQDTCSEISSLNTSTVSTPTRLFERRFMNGIMASSGTSTPTKMRTIPTSTMTNTDDVKSYTSMSSFYGKNSGVEILTCATLDEMVTIKISANNNHWWCILVSVDCFSNFVCLFFRTMSYY